MNATFTSTSRPLVLIILVSVSLNIAIWLLAFFLFPASDAAVLHYSIGIGIDFIGSGRQIYLLPVIGLVVLVGNTLLGVVVKRTDLRSAWLLWSTILPVQVVLLGSFLLIWLVNK